MIAPPAAPVMAAWPAAPLRAYVSHYWLSRDNRDDSLGITPDGAVDVVVVADTAAWRVEAFGSTTAPARQPLEAGRHYLGIRFKPGQSRHFLDAPALALTNAVHRADDAFLPDLSRVAESIASGAPFALLDAALLQHLQRRPARPLRIDEVIRYLQATHGTPRMAELADMYCRSARQFERSFLDVVGLSPKLFASIVRFQRACALLTRPDLPLAQIAAAAGYTDQSHFTHAFTRFHGHPPARARRHAAFLQDPCGPTSTMQAPPTHCPRSPPMKINSLYPVIMTDDVAGSKAFWTTHFPFTVAFEADWYVSLTTGQQPAFELALLDPSHPSVPQAFRRKFEGGLIVNIEVDDVDAEYERLRRAALPVHLALRSEEFGQRHFITADPNGVLVDVIQVIAPSAAYASQYDQSVLQAMVAPSGDAT